MTIGQVDAVIVEFTKSEFSIKWRIGVTSLRSLIWQTSGATLEISMHLRGERLGPVETIELVVGSKEVPARTRLRKWQIRGSYK